MDAVLDVNRRGSTGYGRAEREARIENWVSTSAARLDAARTPWTAGDLRRWRRAIAGITAAIAG